MGDVSHTHKRREWPRKSHVGLVSLSSEQSIPPCFVQAPPALPARPNFMQILDVTAFPRT